MSINDGFFDQQLKQQQEPEQQPEEFSHTVKPVEAQEITQPSLQMPADAKKALVSLLRYGVVLAQQKAKPFTSLCRYQDTIRAHLANMYLKLKLDEKMGVAFIENMNDDDIDDEFSTDQEEITSLIVRRTLTLYDTLLLLVLRKHYQERESTGEQTVVIDVENIESNMTPFLALTNSSKTDRRKLSQSLTKLRDKKIIAVMRGSNDRFEITPMIRYVVNAEFLEKLLSEYLALAKQTAQSNEKNQGEQ